METILSEKSGRETIEEEGASPAKKRKIEEGQLVGGGVGGGSLYSVWHVCIDMIDYCHNAHEMLSMFLAQVLFVVVVQNKHTKIASHLSFQEVSYIEGKPIGYRSIGLKHELPIVQAYSK